MAGLAVLALHALGGHAHADLLVPVLLTNHIAGDAHHEGAGACESVQRVAQAGAAEALPTGQSVPEVTASSSRSGSLGRPLAIPRPPRFLLHAAFLN